MEHAVVPIPTRHPAGLQASHLAELAELLARGLIRLRLRRSTREGSTRETVRVDFSAGGSGHAAPQERKERPA